MARKPVASIGTWPSLTIEGNLIAPAMVSSIDRRDASDQSEADYGVRKGLTIREEISAAFRVGQAHFDDFSKVEDPSPAATIRFVRDFLIQTFGFADLSAATAPVALTAGDGRVPIVVVSPADQIDRRSAYLSTDRSRSAAFALQDHLNDRDDAQWGLATNGTHIRLMRDNASLTRPAYIEANLAQIFTTDDIASFAALWLLIHRSRFGNAPSPATDCPLERWRDTGAREGETARNRLAAQVEEALKILGSGFLEANPDLRTRISSGQLPITDWFNELLRLVYRLIFLMVAEDRNLLQTPDANADARKLYAEGYSLTHLRGQAIRRSAWDRHHDRYEGMKIVFRALMRGEPRLGLPALGGLFTATQLPDLETAKLPNRAFLNALYRLSWLTDGNAMVPVNWRAMETEELGSVYESLLELQPQIANGNQLVFASDATETKGNQRKTTGSYYTPDSLVQALLDTALDPVLDQIDRASANPADELMNLTVIDPACGSGHFLLAAARRIATRVARHRTGGTPSATDFRHALRDTARRCLHGVDRNPMAVELTKVALWIETVDPGLPLGFFDAQIRCGDALLGVFDLKALDAGIPDAAYKPLSGDDKDTAKYYLKANRDAKAGQGDLPFDTGISSLPGLRSLAADYTGFRSLLEDTLDQIETKRSRYDTYRNSQRFHCDEMACDMYVAAFLLPKVGGPPISRGARQVPTSEDVWIAKRNGQVWGPLIGRATVSRTARAFHWPLEFPDIMARGGFDVILGNPPYGAEVAENAKALIRENHPFTASATNTCADFVSLALRALSSNGHAGFVVPKSITYSNSWSGTRKLIGSHLTSTVDIGQAWGNVALEMVLIGFRKGFENASAPLLLRKGLAEQSFLVDRIIAADLDIIPTGLNSTDLKILELLHQRLRPDRARVFSTSRGQGLQKFAAEEGDMKLIAGRNIRQMGFKGPWKYISGQHAGRFELLPFGTVVFQNIVAHLTRPTDHIMLIGSVTDTEAVALDTVNVIKFPADLNPRAVAVFLMSNFISWFVYVCGFNRAVRTMHFDNFILDKLPYVQPELFARLEFVLKEPEAAISDEEWSLVNRLVCDSVGLSDDLRHYLDEMHPRKEVG